MNTPYPTLNFGLGEEIDMLRDAVYQMCAKEIAPRAPYPARCISSPIAPPASVRTHRWPSFSAACVSSPAAGPRDERER